MSTYSSYSDYYTQSREGIKRLQEAAPKKCPHCQTEINQNLGTWEKPHPHCGAPACRAALYRLNKANRLEQARKNTQAQIWQYCTDNLTTDQRRAVMDMVHQVMAYNPKEGHLIAEAVVKVIQDRSCKHDHIKVLQDNSAIAKRRQEKTADFASELQALYEHRITELEAEIKVYQTLESAVYQVALDQSRKQPDPPQRPAAPAMTEEEAQEAADYQRTLEILRQANIRPISTISREELEGLNEEEEEGDEGAEFEDEEEE